MLGKSGTPPFPPVNLLADFAGGGLLTAMGICAALYERTKSGKGQIVDTSMVNSAADFCCSLVPLVSFRLLNNSLS